jgi:predicted aldo/keto reductase-like oxidoreductase
MADYVRDALGFQNGASYAHFETGKALSGYQTTAHFLLWLDKKNPNAVTLISKRLINNTHSKNSFQEIFNESLDQLVMEYESSYLLT